MRRLGRTLQRGAALLTAMIIVALVTTIAVSMIWQQWRAIEVEQGERARTQAGWLLLGALDWARLVLREDARNRRDGVKDYLGEPWSLPLAEARLSSFLAADQNDNADTGPEVFLSGAIVDLQSRFNLRNLVTNDNALSEPDLERLQALCSTANVSAAVATRVARSMQLALRGLGGNLSPSEKAPLMPKQLDDLAWFGLDAATIQRLAPFVTLLPQRTSVNVNTASREVLAATLDIDLSTAERLVQQRQRTHGQSTTMGFNSLSEVGDILDQRPGILRETDFSVSTAYFEVRGRLRMDRRVIEQRSVVHRAGANKVDIVSVEKLQLQQLPPS